MELAQAIHRRRMVRNFEDRPVPAALLDEILADSLRAPSAGHSQGWSFVVLEGEEQTAPLWELTTTPGWRQRTVRHAGLLRAPVVVLPLAHAQSYIDRYSAPDKAGAGLTTEEAWPVPYWLVDTAFATMILLLRVVDAGLGACFFGIFRGEAALLDHLGVPPGYRPIGGIAIGYPAQDLPSPSLARGRRPPEEVVHRARW